MKCALKRKRKRGEGKKKRHGVVARLNGRTGCGVCAPAANRIKRSLFPYDVWYRVVVVIRWNVRVRVCVYCPLFGQCPGKGVKRTSETRVRHAVKLLCTSAAVLLPPPSGISLFLPSLTAFASAVVADDNAAAIYFHAAPVRIIVKISMPSPALSPVYSLARSNYYYPTDPNNFETDSFEKRIFFFFSAFATFVLLRSTHRKPITSATCI